MQALPIMVYWRCVSVFFLKGGCIVCNQPYKPTSADIAQLAGVSRSTVSRVINGYANVPEATRKRVLDIIQQYGYYPSISGKTLRGMRAHCVGVFLNDEGRGGAQASMLYAFSERAQRHGYMTLSGRVEPFAASTCGTSVRRVLHSGCVDAGVFLDAAGGSQLIEQLLTEGQTIGAVGMPVEATHERLFTVGLNPGVARHAVEYALALRFRQATLLCERPDQPFCRALCRRFMNCAENTGLTVVCPRQQSGQTLDLQVADALATLPQLLVCIDQASVFAAYRQAAARGLAVGADVSILGMGLFAESLPLWPTLTGYRFDSGEMIDSLADRLIQNLQGVQDTPRQRLVEGRWMDGGSCASPVS